jgi:putative hydrolases of HD superfamily
MTQDVTARKIVDFLAFSARLKSELRHSWLVDGRQESVAEHGWQLALFALVAHVYLDAPIDLLRTLKMAVIHDLMEAGAGDVPFFADSTLRREKLLREREAVKRIRERLGDPVGVEIFDLFEEYEAGHTREARFVKALDNLEVQLQHNLADLATWQPVEYELVYTKMDRYCAHDAFLRALCAAIKDDAERKMIAADVDIDAVRTKAGS